MARGTTERSFDELASGLADGTLTRGRALRLMGAALVGGALASLGIGEASADDCKRNGKRCKKDTQCCSGNCDSVSGTCADAPPTCGSVGAPCDSNTDCCDGNCDSSGFCLPPTGQTLIHCDCRDGSRVSRCLSVDCNDPDTLSSLCTPLCANNAGVLGILCAPNTPACA
jgi:hypothetical protein